MISQIRRIGLLRSSLCVEKRSKNSYTIEDTNPNSIWYSTHRRFGVLCVKKYSICTVLGRIFKKNELLLKPFILASIMCQLWLVRPLDIYMFYTTNIDLDPNTKSKKSLSCLFLAITPRQRNIIAELILKMYLIMIILGAENSNPNITKERNGYWGSTGNFRIWFWKIWSGLLKKSRKRKTRVSRKNFAQYRR